MQLPTSSLLLTGYLLIASSLVADLQIRQPDEERIYKSTPQGDLKLHFYFPSDHTSEDPRPVIIFFFGGGWNGGSPSQFYPHCSYLSDRGMVAIAAEYRIRSVHETDPRTCVLDGNSAIRWLHSKASELGLDPDRIAAGGGSAGGHVAAATATLTQFDETNEDSSISSQPDALVLFNPVYDNGPNGYGQSRVSEYWEDFSPMHNLHSQVGPTIVFLGTNDRLIPVSTATEFQHRLNQLEVPNELYLYPDQEHGFFNHRDPVNPYFAATVFAMDRFLNKLGYIQGDPEIESPNVPTLGPDHRQ